MTKLLKRLKQCLTTIMLKRYGIAMLAALLFWPIMTWVSPALTVNGMLLDNYWQLGFVAFLNTLAWLFAVAVQRLLNHRHGGYIWKWFFGDGREPWGNALTVIVLLLAGITPCLLAFRFGSELPYREFDNLWRSVVAILAGMLLATVILSLVGLVKCLFVGSEKKDANFFPFEAYNFESVIPWLRSASAQDTGGQEGLRRDSDSEDCVRVIERADGQFLFYLLSLAIIHLYSVIGFSQSEFWLTSAPAMVVLLIWISGMLINGIANVLDQYRLPVVVLAIAFLSIVFVFLGSTRDLKTVGDDSSNQFVAKVVAISQEERKRLDGEIAPGSQQHVDFIAEQTQSLDEAAWQAIVKRMEGAPEHPTNGKTLVIVTCPGGGIHAAAWSAAVMDGLCDQYSGFKDSISVISGVSGGSVGTLMFVSTRYESELRAIQAVAARNPSVEDTHEELGEFSPGLDLAAQSSLEAIAYGITADEIYGAILPNQLGRGQRLEDSFQSRLPEHNQGLTMGDWGDKALDGYVPIVIFNSTDAVTGRRVLFDTIPTPRRESSVGLTSRPINYREMMGVRDGKAYDVLPATATRTSATFPYISPFTKPGEGNERGNSVAICDGGYVDNEGIVTAVNWTEFILRRWADLPPSDRPFQRILMVRIEPAPTADDGTVPDAGGGWGWFRWLAGPVETIINVRSASQLERGNLESDLAALYLKPTPEPRSPAEKKATGVLRTLLGNRKKSFGSLKTEKQTLGAVVAPEANVSGQAKAQSEELPVVVVTVRFEKPENGGPIPLNWKLSTEQKHWYKQAWEDASNPYSSLSKSVDTFFEKSADDKTLDR